MKREIAVRACVFGALVGLAVAVRLVTGTPNFGAVAAASLFAGFYFHQRTTAIAVPLAIMTISDQFLGGYARGVMIAVYASMLIPIAWRSVLRTGLTPVRVAAGSMSASVAFYLLTNAAVWYVWYPHTWADLAHCYAVALPFFFNTLASDGLFSATFFGLYAVAVHFRPQPVLTASLPA